MGGRPLSPYRYDPAAARGLVAIESTLVTLACCTVALDPALPMLAVALAHAAFVVCGALTGMFAAGHGVGFALLSRPVAALASTMRGLSTLVGCSLLVLAMHQYEPGMIGPAEGLAAVMQGLLGLFAMEAGRPVETDEC